LGGLRLRGSSARTTGSGFSREKGSGSSHSRAEALLTATVFDAAPLAPVPEPVEAWRSRCVGIAATAPQEVVVGGGRAWLGFTAAASGSRTKQALRKESTDHCDFVYKALSYT
jgi:hypothetical protein